MGRGGAWLVAGTPGALTRATPLIDAHRATRPVRVVELETGPPPPDWWAGQLDDVRAAVLLTDGDLPIADAVAGTHLRDGDALVPLGVVPDTPVALGALAAVQERACQRMGTGPAVVLGGRQDRARELAARLVDELSVAPRLLVRRLTSDRLPRYDLPAALGTGPGVAIYVGEGHPMGWAAYGGFQAWRLDIAGVRPLGALLSMTCHGASRAGRGPSFSEDVVRRGVAGAALGAVGLTAHGDNARLAVAVAERIGRGACTLADAVPVGAPQLARYRIAGDPLAPLVGAHGSRRGIARVFAPAPGEALPPVDWSPLPSVGAYASAS